MDSNSVEVFIGALFSVMFVPWGAMIVVVALFRFLKR